MLDSSGEDLVDAGVRVQTSWITAKAQAAGASLQSDNPCRFNSVVELGGYRQLMEAEGSVCAPLPASL